jgi:hypothetical protein
MWDHDNRSIGNSGLVKSEIENFFIKNIGKSKEKCAILALKSPILGKVMKKYNNGMLIFNDLHCFLSE